MHSIQFSLYKPVICCLIPISARWADCSEVVYRSVCISQKMDHLVDRNEVQKVESTFRLVHHIFIYIHTLHCSIVSVYRSSHNMSVPRVLRTVLRTSLNLRAPITRLPTRAISRTPIYQSFRKASCDLDVRRKANERIRIFHINSPIINRSNIRPSK